MIVPILVVAGSATPAGAQTTAPAPVEKLDPHVAGRVLVGFRPGTRAADKAAARSAVGASRTEPLSRLAADSELLTLGAGRAVPAALASLRANPNVRFAEPDYLRAHTVTSNDPYYTGANLWGMYGDATSPANAWGSQAGEAWASGFIGSSQVYVGVIDEGINISHPDLAANIWSNPFDRVDGIDNDGNGFIDDTWGWDFNANDRTVDDGAVDDHGTHVSGTIGGVGGNGVGVAGVNWNVTLISAKFLGTSGGTTSNAVRAVDYITDLKVRHGINIVVTSNSWGGGGSSQALLDAINRGGDAGILFVAAAGNSTSNNDSTATYPANYACTTRADGTPRGWDCVVSVAAITNTGALASFSNYGATTTDLGAPGANVNSTVPGGYASYSGTSMATPHVSGAVALCAAINPALTASQRRTALFNSVAATPSLAGKTSTNGRLDVGAMTAQCQGPVAPVSGSPANLTAAPSATSVRLTWTDGTSGEFFHEVQRGDGTCSSFATVVTVGSNATTAVVDGLTPRTSYCFRVRAGNTYNGGSYTPWTTGVRVTTPEPPPPPAPYACASTTYAWVDGGGSGSTRRSLADDASVSVSIGFPFTWYGTSYTSVHVGSNGVIAFGDPVTSYANTTLPTSTAPNNLAAVLWDDLNPGAGGQILTRTLGTSPNRQFVAVWNGVPHFTAGGAATFEVVLDESTQALTYQYQDVVFGNAAYDRGASATVGTESPTGEYGTQVSFNTASIADLSAVRCTTQATAPPVVTTTSVPAGTVGVLYSATLAASGGSFPLTWSVAAGSLPAGVTLSANGVLSGTPTTAGSATFTVRVTDGGGRFDDQALTLVVNPTVTVITPALPPADAGASYSTSLSATGGQSPYRWAVASGALPDGLTLSSTGTISGSSTAVGSASVTIRALDANDVAGDRKFSLTVNDAVRVTTTSLPEGTVGVAYGATLAAAGGQAPYGWSVSAGSLPAGVSLSPTGELSGIPATAGSTSVTLRATDSTGSFAEQTFTVAVFAPVTITTASLVDAIEANAYSVTLAATGGSGSFSWALAAGSLPAGMTLWATGVLSGTPTATGSSTFTVRATDATDPSRTATADLNLVVGPATAQIVKVTSIDVRTTTGTGGTSATATATVIDPASGRPVGSILLAGSWTAAGTAIDDPATAVTDTTGIATIASPTYSGVVAGMTVSFCLSAAAPADYLLDPASDLCGHRLVAAPLTVTTTMLANARRSVAYSTTLVATGGAPTYSWWLDTGSALPPGLTLSPSGLLSGVPTTSGTFTFTVVARDAGDPALTATRALSLTVDIPVRLVSVVVTTSTSSKGVLGSAVVTVADDLGNRVASVNVDGIWTISGRTYAATAKTGGTGSVTIRSQSVIGGTGFQFCVTALTRPGYVSDGSLACGAPGARAVLGLAR